MIVQLVSQPETDDRYSVTLSVDLITALEPLARREGLPVGAFVSILINEALAYRLARRPFKPSD